MELTGTITHLLGITGGTSKAKKAWTKGEFVIEVPGKFPKSVKFTCMGQIAQNLDSYNVGDQATVQFDVESREYQGKWYSDIKAFKMAVERTMADKNYVGDREVPAGFTNPPPIGDKDNDIPF